MDSLTGLRWWAAFGVFVFHFRNVGTFPGLSLGMIGHTGVAFFFVLSGFVLTWSARPTTTVRQFWMRRVARIWPAHLVALALAIPVFYAADPDPAQWWVKPLQWGPILASVVLLQGFSLNPLYLFGGNPAAWTLSCEALFYALHPGLHKVAARLRGHALPAAGVLIVAVGGLANAVDVLPVPVERGWEFCLGMLAALALKRGWRLVAPMPLVYVSCALVALTYWAAEVRHLGGAAAETMAPLWPVVLPPLYALAIQIAASADLEGRPSLMRTRIMVIGGEWSYCFYLVHATVLYAFAAVHPERVHFAGFLGLLGVCVAAAAALHYAVERPCEKRLRAWGDRRFGARPS